MNTHFFYTIPKPTKALKSRLSNESAYVEGPGQDPGELPLLH